MQRMEECARAQRYGRQPFDKKHAWTVSKMLFRGYVLILWWNDTDGSTHVEVAELPESLVDEAYSRCKGGV